MRNKLLGPNNKLSQNLRLVILIAGIVLVLVNLFMVDYGQLWSRDNLGEGLQIFANLCLVAAMVVSIRHTRRQKENEDVLN